MLQFATIQPETLGLLRQLMSISSLSSFSLAGGTALALMYGHRLSVDIDLFVNTPFDQDETLLELRESFDTDRIQVLGVATNSINCVIDGVKVDILAHRYPLIGESKQEDGIRLYSVADIAAMKIGAASGRGSKKDFYDLYELLQHYTLIELLGYYKEKYQMDDAWFVVRSLTYFDDAEITETPITLKGQEWNEVKSFLHKVVDDYLPS